MENNDIINVTDEVIDVATEAASAGLSKGFKFGLGVGLIILTGGAAYKYVIKPITKKIKAKREQRAEDGCDEDQEDDNS